MGGESCRGIYGDPDVIAAVEQAGDAVDGVHARVDLASYSRAAAHEVLSLGAGLARALGRDDGCHAGTWGARSGPGRVLLGPRWEAPVRQHGNWG